MSDATSKTTERQPPKSWRTCPQCFGRATKIFSLSTGEIECQQCDHRYEPPAPPGSHYCPDWDGALVRVGDPEMECCTCQK